MRIGMACKALGGIDNDTIKNWIDRDELAKFFSSDAHGNGKTQREITDSDLILLNTVRSLRTSGRNDWIQIAGMLDDGYRDTNLPPESTFVEGTAPIQLYNNALATTRELAEARELAQTLQKQIVEIHSKHADEIKEIYERLHGEQRAELRTEQHKHQSEQERLFRELATLQAALDVAQDRVRLFESGRLKALDGAGEGGQ